MAPDMTCVDCPAGSYSDSEDAPECIPCAEGFASHAAAASCTRCEEQGLVASLAQSECQEQQECELSGGTADGSGQCVCAGGYEPASDLSTCRRC